MNILILGGTGAMGSSLVELLRESNNKVWVTSRGDRVNSENVNYIKGNAHDLKFLQRILENRHYQAVIDFMAYSTKEFCERVDLLLDNTEQYFYLSSSRVYAENTDYITESSQRLLDVSKDKEYLATDEYALAKARQENILFSKKKKNWTIIRPYKTYNNYRFQLGMYEKEEWLYRVLLGKTLVFPREMTNKVTTLTFGNDVARSILRLIGEPKAYGEAFHITSEQAITWGEIIEIYSEIIRKKTGIKMKVQYQDDINVFFQIWNRYQIIYDCNLNRKFDDRKNQYVIGKKIDYLDIHKGLGECLEAFIESPNWRSINWKVQKWMNVLTEEEIRISEIPGIREKMRFVKYGILDRAT